MANRLETQRIEAYRRLRPMLLHGQIPEGTRLGETQWASKLGVNRGALREAFSLLAHEGLLTPGERGGHFVPEFDREDLDEILELRVALEIGALRLLQHRGAKLDVQPLRMICQTMRHLCDSRMMFGFAEADGCFHRQIVEQAGNRKMIRAYLQAPVLISVRVEGDEAEQERLMLRTIEEHHAICDELEDARHDRAAALLEAHLLTTHTAFASAPLSVRG